MDKVPQPAAAGLATGGAGQPAPSESIARTSNEWAQQVREKAQGSADCPFWMAVADEITRLEQCHRAGWLHAKEVEDEYRKRMGHGFGEKQSDLTELALAGLRARLSCAQGRYSDEASGEPVWENWSRDQLIGQIKHLRAEVASARAMYWEVVDQLKKRAIETADRLHEAETILAQALTCGVDGDHAEWMLKAIAFLNLPAQPLKANDDPLAPLRWICIHCNTVSGKDDPNCLGCGKPRYPHGAAQKTSGISDDHCEHDISIWATCPKCAAKKTSAPTMAMLPNDHHPGPRCSCRECLDRYTADVTGESRG